MQGSIRMNQLGYLPGAKKGFVTDCSAETFAVYDAHGWCIYEGRLEEPTPSAISGEVVRRGDFSPVRAPGQYKLVIPGVAERPEFVVAHNVYQGLQQALLKFFYYQRCGTQLSEEYAGPWSHAACHLGECIDYDHPEVRRPSIGGWHDAGDYGKYTVAAAVTVADLLLAYECFPHAFRDSLSIPESGNGMPDILNEVAYELRWLWTMQRPDGAVYHKVTTKEFPGLNMMPEADEGQLYFSPVSSAATAAFAAVMALASRVYRAWDPKLAERCQRTAEQAYQWGCNHPDAVRQGFRNPFDIHTGEYGDNMVADEWYWASAELWRLTGNRAYLDSARRLWDEAFNPTELGWADVGGYGTWAILDGSRDGRHGNPSTQAWLRELQRVWCEGAASWADLCRANPYGVCLSESDYIWGSNMVLLNRAMHMILADRLQNTTVYREHVLQQLHYILGFNPLAQSYVSGFGTKPMRYPHHRPSVADGVPEPVPGMLAGGPNRHRQDEAARAKLPDGTPPAKCYIDDEGSYSTNEVAIYWNSPAVFVSAYANALRI
ncbi:MAG: glycoside hydrolase family 9 protein [Alicyclobacillus herbarius]|uniref:glycoside hydrolase family 9 protein n=1 Tax=Alicyclobacillus herbarius TaxID=122960 RepID=UPI002352C370|nr:glycoside hydrolase family 9 protein [Alicyclobacillus herbarius]MCL6632439.1 glycoside hydrolase family 9 protein [Alicyclobacillus herbarius]